MSEKLNTEALKATLSQIVVSRHEHSGFKVRKPIEFKTISSPKMYPGVESSEIKVGEECRVMLEMEKFEESGEVVPAIKVGEDKYLVADWDYVPSDAYRTDVSEGYVVIRNRTFKLK